jgi:hypothetical protein
MTDPRIIPWKRITVEAVAIVVSILLAFTIDAWWAERQDRHFEHAALQALRGDFKTSRDNMAGLLEALANAQERFVRFRSSTPAQLAKVDRDAARQILASLVMAGTFDPVTTTLDSLVSDGRLGLVRDPALLAHLSNWQRALSDIEANILELRAESLRVRRAMEMHGGPFFQWSRHVDSPAVLPTANGEILAALRLDADFMGKARSHQYVLSGYLWELRSLAEILDSMLALLDENAVQH